MAFVMDTGADAQLDLGRMLFDRQCDEYDANDALRESAWADPKIRAFWVAEARAVFVHVLDRARDKAREMGEPLGGAG